MRVVFGIGNPGPQYTGTRHNLGFEVLDEIARRAGSPWGKFTGLPAQGATVTLGGGPVLLVKPLTYVNRSGPVLAALAARGPLPAARLLVVVDDLDLDLGRLRLRGRGRHGGHNGLRSLEAALGTDGYPRLRMGIGGPPPGTPAAAHALARFEPEERPVAEGMVARAADGVALWSERGLERAMPDVNRRDLDRPAPGA